MDALDELSIQIREEYLEEIADDYDEPLDI
jgi:hypothetical protein